MRKRRYTETEKYRESVSIVKDVHIIFSMLRHYDFLAPVRLNLGLGFC